MEALTTTPTNTPDALIALLDAGGGAIVGHAFACMDIAEEEITSAKHRWPLQAHAIDNTFRYLCPSQLLLERADTLYRAHCRELLTRVGQDDRPDLDQPTDAELCVAFQQASLTAPLNHDHATAYFQIFRELFREKAEEMDLPEPHESYPGRTEEILEGLRRRLRPQTQRTT